MPTAFLDGRQAREFFEALKNEVDINVYQKIFEAYTALVKDDPDQAKKLLIEAVMTTTELRRVLEAMAQPAGYREIMPKIKKKSGLLGGSGLR